MWHQDPGPCIVCGTPHTACTAPTEGPIVSSLFTQRGPVTVVIATPQGTGPHVAEAVQAQLPPGQFTTGTYRRKKR